MKKFLIALALLFVFLSPAPAYALIPDGHGDAAGRVMMIGATPGIGYPGEPLTVSLWTQGRMNTVSVRFHFRPFVHEGEEWTYAVDVDVHNGLGEMVLVLPCTGMGLLDISSGHITLTILVSHPVPGVCTGEK